MLDNWKPGPLRSAIRAVRRFPSKPWVEVSGRIRLANVREVALAGPDFISVGSLTHSAAALDMSLDFERA
jgi:nicotinate-nucleotide pyrophosphorylase (carboxylating)